MAEITILDMYHRENQVTTLDLFPHNSHSYSIDDPTLNREIELGLGFSIESTHLCDLNDDVADIPSGFSPSDRAVTNPVESSTKETISAMGIDLSPGFGDERERAGGRVDERDWMSILFGFDMNDDVVVATEEEEMVMEQMVDSDWENMFGNWAILDPILGEEFLMPTTGQLGVRNPPAAVENFRAVVVTEADVECGDATCVICRDQMVVGEKAKSLPCSHRYHWCCIDPWLRMRNTCPVCQYELSV